MKRLFFIFFTFISYNIFAQLQVQQVNANSAVQDILVGGGVSISNVQYSGAGAALGKFTTGNNQTNLGFSEGIIMSTGRAVEAANNVSFFASTDTSAGSDPQLAGLVTQNIRDACVLTFNFIPESDTVMFRYVFASEEYPTFANSNYNDVFGFFITGPNPDGGNYSSYNIARLPGTNTAVSINNVNNGPTNSGPCQNCQYYVNNQSPSNPYIAYNGATVVLTAWAKVIPCNNYHIKLAIGDANDGIYDSGVFLEANSFSSPQIEATPHFETEFVEGHIIEGCSGTDIVFKLPFIRQIDHWIEYSFQGTATPEVDYTIEPNNYEFLVVPAGQDSAVLRIDALVDDLVEGTEYINLVMQTSLCGNTWDTIIIPIFDNVPIDLSIADDTLLCMGGDYHLWVEAEHGVPPYSYLWSNEIIETNQIVSPEETTTYYISVSDVCDNLSIDSVAVVSGSVWIEAMPDTTICEGNSVQLFANGPGDVVWFGFDDENPIVSPEETTTYTASISNICGESVGETTVFVDKIPYFDIDRDTLICDYDRVVIGPQFVNGMPEWNTGAKTSQISVNEARNYVLTVVNGTCNYSDSINIGYKSCNFWMPNAFIPIEGSYNPVFKPVGVSPDNYEMLIFDRWGKLIYNSTDFDEGWDGKIGGEKAPSGIYFYQIFGHLPGTNDKTLLKQDKVHLIR